MSDYPYPARRFSLDRVAQQLYEGGNLCEEVYRALGGDALPFYAMLHTNLGGLRYKLQLAADAYLKHLELVFEGEGIRDREGNRVPVRPLDVGWRAAAVDPRAPIFEEAK